MRCSNRLVYLKNALRSVALALLATSTVLSPGHPQGPQWVRPAKQDETTGKRMDQTERRQHSGPAVSPGGKPDCPRPKGRGDRPFAQSRKRLVEGPT